MCADTILMYIFVLLGIQNQATQPGYFVSDVQAQNAKKYSIQIIDYKTIYYK